MKMGDVLIWQAKIFAFVNQDGEDLTAINVSHIGLAQIKVKVLVVSPMNACAILENLYVTILP